MAIGTPKGKVRSYGGATGRVRPTTRKRPSVKRFSTRPTRRGMGSPKGFGVDRRHPAFHVIRPQWKKGRGGQFFVNKPLFGKHTGSPVPDYPIMRRRIPAAFQLRRADYKESGSSIDTTTPIANTIETMRSKEDKFIGQEVAKTPVIQSLFKKKKKKPYRV